jgi:hypothetical protein
MTFKIGYPPNPAGRPKGSSYKQILFKEEILPHSREIARQVIQMARDGNESMIKMLAERIFPRVGDNPVPFDLDEHINDHTLTKASEGIIKLVAAGDLLPEEGKIVTEMLKTHKDSLVLQEMMNKLTEMQAKVDSMEKK